MPKQSVKLPHGTLINKFPSRCRRCHEWVRPGDGFIAKDKLDGWVGEHRECPETDGMNEDESIRWDYTWG